MNPITKELEILQRIAKKYKLKPYTSPEGLYVWQGIMESDYKPLDLRIMYWPWEDKISFFGSLGDRGNYSFWCTYQMCTWSLNYFPELPERYIGQVYYTYQQYITSGRIKEDWDEDKKLPDACPDYMCQRCEYFDGVNMCFNQKYWGTIWKPCKSKFWRPKILIDGFY